MQAKFEDRVIALAGIAQAIFLTQEIAQTGRVDEKAFKASLNSLFQLNPPNAMAIYGGLDNLQYGLEKLVLALRTKPSLAYKTIKQMIALINLQKKIARSPSAMSALSQRLQQAQKQVDYFNLQHSTVIANLADTYIDIVNRFHFRFYLSGNEKFFGVKENMEKIRVLLLTAIRACVLWQQSGGSCWQLIFEHKKIKFSALDLLNKLTH